MQLIEGGPRPPVFAEGGDFPAYGADAVRWGLLAISSSQDVRFNEERVAQGRQLANKLYNASRLVLLRLPEDAAAARTPRPRPRRSRTPGSSRACRPPSATWRAAIDASTSTSPRCASTTSSTASCATGTSSCSSRACTRRTTSAVGEFALHVLAETLALAHPLIPFVTEEIWGHVPGADGLLMARRYPVADDALADPDAEAQLARAIEAVQELRAWRDSVGAAPGRPIPARLDGDGLRGHRRARGPARAAGVDRRRRRAGGDGGDPRRRRWPCSPPTPWTSRPRQRRAAGAPRGARVRDRPRRGQARQRAASWPRRRRRWCRPSATSSRACGRSSRSCDLVPEQRAEEHLLSLELFGMRFGLERMRRLLTALGSPQERFAAVHVVGTNGKSSTVRMTAALLEAARRAHGRLPLAAPRALRRARSGSATRTSPATAFGAAVERAAAAAAKVDRTLSRRRARDPVRAADRRRARRAGPPRGRGRGRRGRPGRALGRHQRARRGRLRAHQRRAGAHALARPDGGRHRAREARRGPAGRDARARRGGRRGRGAGARDRRADRAGRSALDVPLRGYQRTNFARRRRGRGRAARRRSTPRRWPRSPRACASRAACRWSARTR